MTSMVAPAHPSAFYLRDSYEFSFAISIFFHILLLLLLFYGWSYRSKDIEMATPRYVQARLVKMNTQSAVAKPEPVKEIIEPIIIRPLQREVIQPPKENKNQLQQKKLKEEKLKQEKLKEEQEKQAQLEKQQQQAQAEQTAREKAEAEKRKADQALAKELADEQALQQASADDQLAQNYQAAIQQRLVQNWNRPASAQKGMEVLLEIQLVPTGYVVGVSVLKSSGSPAFDLSAQQAVYKADHFPEVKDIPSRVFEKHFRHLKIMFNMKDNF